MIDVNIKKSTIREVSDGIQFEVIVTENDIIISTLNVLINKEFLYKISEIEDLKKILNENYWTIEVYIESIYTKDTTNIVIDKIDVSNYKKISK